MTEQIKKQFEAAKTEEEARALLKTYESDLTEEDLKQIAGGYNGPLFVYTIKNIKKED